jgi:penicillin amidase
MKKHLLVSLLLLLASISISGQGNITRISVAGLKAEVSVTRDGRGIPYIEARNETDMYFAQGYIMASDRLWQMDLMRRLARGQMAEVFGTKTLEEDKRWRRFGFASIVEKSLLSMTQESRAALESYARGVNAYIATLDDKTTPPEFKILQYKPTPWKPTDSLIIVKILADGLSSTWRTDLIKASLTGMDKQKFADLMNPVTPSDVVLFGKDKPAAAAAAVGIQGVSSEILAAAKEDDDLRTASLERVGLYAEDLAASNNWVISGKRTADGRAMLANDPHLSPSAPGIWYLIDIRSPGVHVAGVTIPGGPGVAIGHNDHIAWGMTNVGPDVQDLYAETFNDAGEYKTPTGWAKPVIRKEIISVRSNPMKTDMIEQTIEVMETRNGVVIQDEAGKKYALKWTARDPRFCEFTAIAEMDRAKDWTMFKKALRSFGLSPQNVVFADIKGNIGWHVAGQVPIRKTGDGSLPYDGSTTDGDWLGNIPFDELPNLYNPSEGFIVTANQRIAGTDYKYQQMTRTFLSARARRIHDLLSAKTQGMTMDDCRDIQLDVYNEPLARFAKSVVAEGSVAAETLAVLREWDGKMTPDSRGAVLATHISGCVIDKMADDNKPVPTGLIFQRIFDTAIREKLDRWLPENYKTYGELYKACDDSVRTSLAASKIYGSDPLGWVWGKGNVSRFPHPLGAVPLIGGQFATPTVGIAGSNVSQTPNVGSGVSMRLIASPGNWDATRHVIPLGESGNPQSPHFKDQFEAWRTGIPMVFPFSKGAIEKAAIGVVVMSPR